jgi:hypothetical protein
MTSADRRDEATARDFDAQFAATAFEVKTERLYQQQKWADCERLPDGTGGAGRPTYERIAKLACDRAYREGRVTHAHIFEEEAMEVLNATERPKLRKELVQVMAVCEKWIRDLDLRDVEDAAGRDLEGAGPLTRNLQDEPWEIG